MMVKGLWQWLAVLGVAALCLMFTLAVWRYAVITSRHIADLEFERGAGRIERALTERIRQLETAVRAVQGFAESKAELDVTSWRAFADRLRLGEDGEGVAGVIYYRHEPGDGRQPGGHVVALGAPADRPGPLLGRRIQNAPLLMQSIARARDIGDVVLSPLLVGPASRAYTFPAADMVMVAPVHDPASGALRGMVALGLASGPLLRDVLSRSGETASR